MSCSDHQLTNIDNWLGTYFYEETPVKANGGYAMVMEWELSINKTNNNYQGDLEIDGQQTFIKLLTNIKGDSNAIAVIYNSRLDGSDENLKRGDTLFVLEKDANGLETKWLALEPRLSASPPKECNCFIRIKR